MTDALTLYNSVGPNPRVVRMFAAEKGVALALHELDIIAGENRQAPYLSINPQGSTPALVLPNGQIVTEILAACEYLDEMRPEPALIGSSAEDRARVRTWARKIDLGFALPLTLGFRAAEARAMFEPRMIVVPEAGAAALKAMAFDLLDFVETRHGGADYVAGDALSLADILLFCFVDFGRIVGFDMLVGRPWLAVWFDRIAARPSAAV